MWPSPPSRRRVGGLGKPVRRERSSGPKLLKVLLDGRVQTQVVRRKVIHTLQLRGDTPRKVVFLTRLVRVTPRTDRSHAFAGQLAGLLHPTGELSFVELVVLMDVEVARVLALGLAGGDRTQGRAAEECHLDVLREAMEAEEPALALDSIEGRVPF